ncbi:HD domain-containing phosphohydrolase, partial [Clostridium sp.]|uniref:HD-GYP domain-containing protein n=1 Tax=Clostridium sp. TaxID=1506 RepID=UPI003217172C
MKGLSLKQKGFFLIIYITTVILLVHSIISKNITLELSSIGDIVFFTILTALTESFTVVFKNMSISTTFAITITTYILFGPLSSILILVLGFLFRILKVNNNQYKHLFNTPIYGTVFNCCAIILPIIIGNYVFNAINSSNLTILQQGNISIVVFGVIYFLINALVMSILMSLMTQKHIFYCLCSSVKIGIIHFIVMIPIGLILAMIFNQNKYWGIVCIIIPISLIRYTLLLYSESKSQFIDTVEALMNAIDARDQYTEGHSRRVAEISVAIGKELKYNQWSIEELNIAAMLHDVGKIGVSDTI